MPQRSPAARAAWVVALVPAAAVAVVGGLTLRDHQLVAVGLAATVAACVGASIASQDRAGATPRRVVEAAWRSAVATVGVLLVLAGLAGIGGGWLAAVGGLTGAGVAVAVLVLRTTRRGPGAPARYAGTAPVGDLGTDVGTDLVTDLGTDLVTDLDPPTLLPVSELSTEALGREWQRTANALSAALEPATRQHVVRRRQDTLDELERRDPEGFARWLTAGARSDSDPAEHIQGDAAAGPP